MAGFFSSYDPGVGLLGRRLQGGFGRGGRQHESGLFTLGLLPLMLIVWRSPRNAGGGKGRKIGIAWAFLTGILGGTGNIAFFRALVMGGKASIVSPVTALFPLVTVILAVTVRPAVDSCKIHTT